MTGSKSIVSVTFSNVRSSIRVSMGLLEYLSLPKYIRFLINPSNHSFAIEATSKSDKSGIKVIYPMNKLTNGYVVHSQLLVEQLYELMNWDTTKRYRVYGSFNEEKRVGIFILDNGKTIKEIKNKYEKEEESNS